MRGWIAPHLQAHRMNQAQPFWSSARIVIVVALFITVFGNVTEFSALLDWYRESGTYPPYIASLFVVQFLLLVFLFALLTAHPAYRLTLVVLLLITAVAAYFVDNYGVIIDRQMLINTLQTDRSEIAGLASYRMLLYLGLLFILPAAWLYRIRIRSQTILTRLRLHLGLAAAAFTLTVLITVSMNSFYASFFREQEAIRVYSNPMASLYAAYQLARKNILRHKHAFEAVAEDAFIPESDVDRELVIVVVGETVRADHFSLNGYGRMTNPLLSRRNIVSFTNATSCGTSTAVSVPCMFAVDDRDNFDTSEAAFRENVLDILARAGVTVLWRDNNSSSKGVANRVRYEDFRTADKNPICDPECRDVGMLDGLDSIIAEQQDGDILIVLHQMGSHGPAYFQRVPDEFQEFQPVCATNQLDQCSAEQIANSYDNTILYTDYFLDQVIAFLGKYDDRFETALLYVGDHGESLGEAGLYLHGMPYMLAPDAQTHVPLILWFGRQHDDLDINLLRMQGGQPVSHDDIFSTLLGMFEVSSKVYMPERDLERRAMKADLGV